MERFDLDSFLKTKLNGEAAESRQQEVEHNASFESLCELINADFQREWEDGEKDVSAMLNIQKKAIIGYVKEVNFFKSKIRQYINMRAMHNVSYPPWYTSLEDAVYQENWGLAGIGEWFGEKYQDSSSCKVIGERIYFQEGGKMLLKPQRMGKERREQLVRAFLLLTPEERLDRDFHEIYMLDGTRITIFRGSMVKSGQDTIIFRRYIIPEYSFEEQARRGTIPVEAIPWLKEMVKLGYSIAATGAMKTGKTSFLASYQSYEDESLEGVMLETDPEISLHKLMPHAPILQIIARDEGLKTVTRQLLRSDADYLIMAEARDGIALDTVLRLASKGTRRLKITFHERNPLNFPQDVGAEIALSLGADPKLSAVRAAESFDYIFHFIQLKDKSKKRLKGIYEISHCRESGRIKIVPICKYDFEKDSWSWKYEISKDKELAGLEEDGESFGRFKSLLSDLAREHPMRESEHSIDDAENTVEEMGNEHLG